MIAFLVFGLLAAASAAPAPHFSQHRHSQFSQDLVDGFQRQPFFNNDTFDTQRFLQQLGLELREMSTMIENTHRHSPKSTSSAGIVGNEYKDIPLHGFDEKDISVKASDNVLMVQAVHKTGQQSVNTLPNFVDASGVRTFTNDILIVVFPLKSSSVSTTVTPSANTEDIDYVTRGLEDPEEIDNSHHLCDNNHQGADVNEVQKCVEATTHAVDLKNEVKFDPIYYK